MAQAEHTRGSSRYWMLLVTVSMGTVLAPINSTMLAVALPDIRESFSLNHAELGWLISAYLIAMAVSQPIGGRLSDQLGRARVFRGELVAFLVLSLAAAAAPNFWLLITFRTGQAVVGAAVIPTGMAMIRESVPVTRLAQSNGITGSLISLAAAGGPLLGAAMLALGSWRLLFLVNVPVVALALLAQWRLQYPSRESEMGPVRGLLDWWGALLMVATLIFLTQLLNSTRGGETLGLVVGAVGLGLAGTAFGWRQRRATLPVAGWSLFRVKSYRAATTHVMLTNLVMYTTLLSIPFFIRELQEKGSGTTGILLGAMSIQMVVLAPLSGRMADAYGRRRSTVLGSCVAFVAILLVLLGLDEDVSTGYLAVVLALVGMGVGLGTGPAQTAAIESAPMELAGSAAGTNSMMRYLGSIVGAGILAGVLNTGGAAPGIEVFRIIFVVVGVIAALAIVAASQIHRFPPEVAWEVPPELDERVPQRDPSPESGTA